MEMKHWWYGLSCYLKGVAGRWKKRNYRIERRAQFFVGPYKARQNRRNIQNRKAA